MPEDAGIIKRSIDEVNAMCGESRLRPLVVLLLVATLAGVVGCGSDERRAERMYRQAVQAVEREDLDAAVEDMEEIIRRYPHTETARRAREQIKVYRGLASAVRSYPMRTARDRMVTTARAIEKYRMRRRTFPKSLDALIPEFLPEILVDPWDRPFAYERTRGGRGYTLACYGEDGEPGGTDDAGDIIVKDGAFVASPGVEP